MMQTSFAFMYELPPCTRCSGAGFIGNYSSGYDGVCGECGGQGSTGPRYGEPDGGLFPEDLPVKTRLPARLAAQTWMLSSFTEAKDFLYALDVIRFGNACPELDHASLYPCPSCGS